MTSSNCGSNPRRAWELADAGANLDEILRLARSGRPQRIVVHGRDAVVVVDAIEFDELRAQASGTDLRERLSESPLSQLEFESGERTKSGARRVGALKSEIRPSGAKSSPVPVDAKFDDAVRKGWITPADSPGSEPPRGGPPVATLSELLEELDEDRSR